jgi:chemotaxis signal transduction protein
LQNRFGAEQPKKNKTVYTRFSVFNISDRLFGIEINHVKEVLKSPKITRLPNVKPQLLGVFNLRGTILPLMDLRYILGLEITEKKNAEMVLLFECDHNVMGVLVEKVLDFVNIEDIKIQIPSRSINPRIANYIQGFYEKEGTGTIYLFDPEKLFKSAEIF